MIKLEWTDHQGITHTWRDVLSLRVLHEEGGFAKAFLMISAQASLPPANAISLIFQPNAHSVSRVLMRGYLCRIPKMVRGERMLIELSAEPSDSSARLAAFMATLKPEIDELFIEDAAQDSLEKQAAEFLEPQAALYHWDRVTGDVRLSPVLGGPESMDLGATFDRRSLKIRFQHMPLSSIRVHLEAEWVQRGEGVANIAPLIEQAFPEGVLSTLTGQALMKSWPQPGSHMGQTGYRVLRSKLDELPPVTEQFPALCGPFSFRDQTFYLTRRWFHSQLWIHWRYRQRRHETVTFQVNQSLQNVTDSAAATKTLRIKLQNICPDEELQPWQPDMDYDLGSRVVWADELWECQRPHRSELMFLQAHWHSQGRSVNALGDASRASFFVTQRGLQAIAYAVDIAHSHLVASARCMRIDVDVPFESAVLFDLDSTVALCDPRLPQGRAQGKVIAYEWVFDGDTGRRCGHLTLACAIGASRATTLLKFEHHPSEEPLEHPVEPPVEPPEDSRPHRAKVSGLHFSTPQSDMPPPGILYPCHLGLGDIVESVRVLHNADDQQAVLQENAWRTRAELDKDLRAHATQIHLRLRSLKGCEVLHHNLKVERVKDLQPPCDIDVSRRAHVCEQAYDSMERVDA